MGRVVKLGRTVTLDEMLHRLGDSRLEPVHLAELLQVLVKVCDAVSRAHSRGVFHRDLKPTNIMVTDVGQVYVVGWRMAWWSDLDPPGSVVGTPCYMAPERLLGKPNELDERTDIFALGATLYQMLTGAPPLRAEVVRALWMRRAPPRSRPPTSW
jgi:serine/threonine-protein kinase